MGQVEASLDGLREAGYPLPVYALHANVLEDTKPELYDYSLQFRM